MMSTIAWSGRGFAAKAVEMILRASWAGTASCG